MLSACREVGVKDVVRSYYGSLAHEAFNKKLQVTRRYGQKHIEVIAESFQRQALKLSKLDTENLGQRYLVSVLPPPFRAAR